MENEFPMLTHTYHLCIMYFQGILSNETFYIDNGLWEILMSQRFSPFYHHGTV